VFSFASIRTDWCRVLTHPPQNSQLSKRDAAPGLQVDILENEDASVRTTVLSVDSYDCTDTLNRKRLVRSALPAQPHFPSATLQMELPELLSWVKMAKSSVSDLFMAQGD
jgi:hypothetical protein